MEIRLASLPKERAAARSRTRAGNDEGRGQGMQKGNREEWRTDPQQGIHAGRRNCARKGHRAGKRLLLALAAVFAAFGMLSPATLANEAAGGSEVPDSPMQRLVDAMQPGWNLGNTFDAADGDETSWGNPKVTRELIRAIRAQGYNSIRIPITWNHRMGPGPDYAIREAFMARIQEVVDWCLEAGLIVVINMHHDSRWMLDMENEREEVLAKFRAAWKQIARHFKDYDPERLLFEGINEPRFSEDWNEDRPVFFEMVDELQTAFHETVRESGGMNGVRPLVLTTVAGGHGQARLDALYETIRKLDDPNLIATVHYYGYYPFSVNMAGATTFNETARQDVIHNLGRVHDTFTARGIPVIIGEFGLLGFDKYVDTIQHGEVLKYLEFVTHFAREKRMAHMLWDNGQHFNRKELRWNNPDFHAIMMSTLTGRSSYTERDSVYIRKGENVRDASMRLYLNGNELTGIRAGDRELAPGTDYEANGEQLVLKAGLLKSLLGDGLGPQADLTLSFSAGADWVIHVIQYETPELKDSKMSRANFAIPAKFKGDRLATMEALYVGGGIAGPDDWTPFKEFGKSFDPDYTYGLIRIKQEFFNDVKDGDIKLTFHFWSGTKLDYLLTVSGGEVVGKAPAPEGEEASDEGGGGDPADAAETAAPADGGGTADGAVPANAFPQGASNRTLFWGVLVIAALAALVGLMVFRSVKG